MYDKSRTKWSMDSGVAMGVGRMGKVQGPPECRAPEFIIIIIYSHKNKNMQDTEVAF